MMNSNHSISAFLRSGQWVSKKARFRLVPAALAAGSLVAAGVLLGACSDVPDAVNPVSWYHGVEGWFSDEDEAPPSVKNGSAAKTTQASPPAQTAQNQPSGGSGEAYPTVQEVPDKPITSTVEQRRQMMQGLSADRENAHYADESARAADQAANPPAAGTGTSSATAKSASTPSPMEDTESMMPTVPPPASASSAPATPSTPPAPPAPSTGHKSYMTGLDTGPSAPPPPAVPDKSATAKNAATPPAPPKAEAVTPVAPGSSELNQVYETKLRESAPTVSTQPVGPTATNAPPPGSVAEPPATPEEPVSAIHKTSGKKHAKAKAAEPAMAAATSPSVYVAPEVSEGDLAFGPSSTFGPAQGYDGVGAGAPGQVGVVYFRSGSSELDESDIAKLRQVAAIYSERGGNVRVIGHASSFTRDMDPVHHQMANFNISVRRADAVAHELMKLGVKPGSIFVSARSDSDPVYFESMPAGQVGNQRAEIFIDY